MLTAFFLPVKYFIAFYWGFKLEEKREYYEKQDKEKAKVEEVKAMQMTEAENAEETVVEEDSKMQEGEAKLEAERVKNMTADEKMIYRVDKAKEKIDAMLETAKKARQEELDVGETKAKVEEALKNITENNGTISFEFVNDFATGIHSIKNPSARTNDVYSIDGRYVGKSLHHLPSGIYICNGKKIVIK